MAESRRAIHCRGKPYLTYLKCNCPGKPDQELVPRMRLAIGRRPINLNGIYRIHASSRSLFALANTFKVLPADKKTPGFCLNPASTIPLYES